MGTNMFVKSEAEYGIFGQNFWIEMTIFYSEIANKMNVALNLIKSL